MFLLLALCLCKRRKRMKKTTTWIQTHSSSLNDCKLRHDAGRPAHRATSEFYSVCLSLTHTHTQRSKVKRQGTKIIIIIITPFFDCRHINDVAVSLCVCVYVLDVWPWTPPNGLVAWPSNCSIFTNDGLLLRFLLFLMWKAWAKDVGHAFFFSLSSSSCSFHILLFCTRVEMTRREANVPPPPQRLSRRLRHPKQNSCLCTFYSSSFSTPSTLFFQVYL